MATPPVGGETGVGTARETHFTGTTPRPVTLEEVSPGVRTGLRRGAVIAGGSLGSGIFRVQYGGEEVIRAELDLVGDQQGFVFVNMEGQVVKTQRQASIDSLPLGVRRIVEQQQKGASDTSVMLEEALGQTSYVLRVERENQPARWLQIDASGNVVRTLAEAQAPTGGE